MEPGGFLLPATGPVCATRAVTTFDWTLAEDRERARRLAQRQIRNTLRDAASRSSWILSLTRTHLRGFFAVVYLNSFNEWHEGHQSEPAKKYKKLTDAEKAAGYHNARNGFARYRTLKKA